MNEVKQLELSEELVNEYLIHDVYYNSDKIEINYKRMDGQDDTITLQVLKYVGDTLKQLYSLVNGSMHPDQFTHLMYELNLKLTPIWNIIYVPRSSITKQNEDDADGLTDQYARALDNANRSILKSDENRARSQF